MCIRDSSSTVKVEQSVSLEDTCVLENTAEIEEELWKTYECRKTTADNSHCIVFTPHPEEKKIYRSAYATEQMAEDLIPLLYGNIAETTSTLGAAGIRVPGTAGETTEGLLDKYGIPSLIMADEMCIRDRYWSEDFLKGRQFLRDEERNRFCSLQ